MPRIPDLFFSEYASLAARAGNPAQYRLVSDQQFNNATAYLVITPIFQVIATLIFFARAYTRVYPTWRCGVDDYIIAVAFVCSAFWNTSGPLLTDRRSS